MSEKKKIELLKVIQHKIQTIRKQSQLESDLMENLKLAISQVTYAYLLQQYLQNNKFTIEALLNLSKAYLATENYQQALIQARLARKQASNNDLESKHKATLMIAECMLKQSRFQDAYDVLSAIKNDECSLQCKQAYFQTLLSSLVQLKLQAHTIQTLVKIEELVQNRYGNKSSEYGFFLVKKGKSFGRFGKYDEALVNLNKGVQILIQKKCKQKKQITQIYLIMADYYKKQRNLQKQNSSLICAFSMARQLQEPQKQTLPILHMLSANLFQRQQYQKALKQLKKIKQLEKQLYGQSSLQIAKTTKKITQVLGLLNMNFQAKKSGQEYSRIVASSGNSILKQKSLNVSIHQLQNAE